MITHNTYFDNNVQSLGFSRNELPASVGVIAPGEYHFGTAKAERMSVISGSLEVKLPGAEWQTYPAGTQFEIPANSGFDVRSSAPAAYLCEYFG